MMTYISLEVQYRYSLEKDVSYVAHKENMKAKGNNYHYLDWYRDLNQNPRDCHLFFPSN